MNEMDDEEDEMLRRCLEESLGTPATAIKSISTISCIPATTSTSATTSVPSLTSAFTTLPGPARAITSGPAYVTASTSASATRSMTGNEQEGGLYQGKEAHGFHTHSGRSWIYPTNYPERKYQFEIVKTALFNNTLVSLPTGLGKTFIAAVVMYNFYRWYPLGKVVFMAPTKTLVNQQVDACYNIMGIPRCDTAEMTGSTNPAAREVMWQNKRMFFLTPQTITNDLTRGICPVERIKCVVIDEAHKAQKKYHYVQFIEALSVQNKHFRVLALSATPGSNIKDVKQLLQNLLISRIEVRTEDSADIAQYTHSRIIVPIVVKLGTTLEQFQNRFLEIVDSFSRPLRINKLLYSSMEITKFGLVKARESFHKNPPNGFNHDLTGQIETAFTMCTMLAHAAELLYQHGLRTFYNYLEGVVLDETKKRVSSRLGSCEPFQALMRDVKDNLGSAVVDQLDPNVSIFNPSQIQDVARYECTHPKMERMRDIVLEHFLKCQQEDVTSRVIIFCQYRDVVTEVRHILEQLRPLVKPIQFVGQSTAAGSKAKGLTQKDQKMIMSMFREGRCNTLISTCVGEEGLDIGEVDLIICFDSHNSPIRLVQRMGRTGRQRDGRVVMLLSEGKEHSKYLNSQLLSTKISNKFLSSKRLDDHLYRNNPTMLPPGTVPSCYKMMMTIQAEQKQEKPQTSKQLGKKNQDLRDVFKPLPLPTNALLDTSLSDIHSIPDLKEDPPAFRKNNICNLLKKTSQSTIDPFVVPITGSLVNPIKPSVKRTIKCLASSTIKPAGVGASKSWDDEVHVIESSDDEMAVPDPFFLYKGNLVNSLKMIETALTIDITDSSTRDFCHGCVSDYILNLSEEDKPKKVRKPMKKDIFLPMEDLYKLLTKEGALSMDVESFADVTSSSSDESCDDEEMQRLIYQDIRLLNVSKPSFDLGLDTLMALDSTFDNQPYGQQASDRICLDPNPGKTTDILPSSQNNMLYPLSPILQSRSILKSAEAKVTLADDIISLSPLIRSQQKPLLSPTFQSQKIPNKRGKATIGVDALKSNSALSPSIQSQNVLRNANVGTDEADDITSCSWYSALSPSIKSQNISTRVEDKTDIAHDITSLSPLIGTQQKHKYTDRVRKRLYSQVGKKDTAKQHMSSLFFAQSGDDVNESYFPPPDELNMNIPTVTFDFFDESQLFSPSPENPETLESAKENATAAQVDCIAQPVDSTLYCVNNSLAMDSMYTVDQMLMKINKPLINEPVETKLVDPVDRKCVDTLSKLCHRNSVNKIGKLVDRKSLNSISKPINKKAESDEDMFAGDDEVFNDIAYDYTQVKEITSSSMHQPSTISSNLNLKPKVCESELSFNPKVCESELGCNPKVCEPELSLNPKKCEQEMGLNPKFCGPELGFSPKECEPELGFNPKVCEPELGLNPKVCGQEMGLNPKVCGQEMGLNPKVCGQEMGLNPKVCGPELGFNPKECEPELGFNPKVCEPELGFNPKVDEQELSSNPKVCDPELCFNPEVCESKLGSKPTVRKEYISESSLKPHLFVGHSTPNKTKEVAEKSYRDSPILSPIHELNITNNSKVTNLSTTTDESPELVRRKAKGKKARRKEKCGRRKKRCKFINSEADESEDEKRMSSDGENTLGLDSYDESFVDDFTQQNETQAIQTKYIQSKIKSPDFQPRRHKISFQNVFSQAIPEESESYLNDSFVNDEETEEIERLEISELELAEMALKKIQRDKRKRRRGSDESETFEDRKKKNATNADQVKNRRLKRIKVLSSSSDEDITCSTKQIVSITNISSLETTSKTQQGNNSGDFLENLDWDDDFDVPAVENPVYVQSTSAGSSVKLQPSSAGSLLKVQPSSTSRLLKAQPSTAGSSLKAQPSIAGSKLRMQPSFAEISLKAQPNYGGETSGNGSSPHLLINSEEEICAERARSRPMAQLVLLVSTRQVSAGSSVVSGLRAVHNIKITVRSMPEADYCPSWRLGVARLSLTNFISDRFLTPCVVQLRSAFQSACLIVENNNDTPVTSRTMWRNKSNFENLARLRRANVLVLFSQNCDNTVKLLTLLTEKEATMGHSIINLPQHLADKLETRLQFLELLPGVNLGIALKLVQHFPNLKALIESDPAQLRAVAGISGRLAHKINLVLRQIC